MATAATANKTATKRVMVWKKVMTTATKRAKAMVTRMVGDEMAKAANQW